MNFNDFLNDFLFGEVKMSGWQYICVLFVSGIVAVVVFILL